MILPALILFIKNPRPGKVKTRLAREVGEANALSIYLSLLERIRRVSLEVDADRVVYYSDFIPEKDEWAPSHFRKRLQTGDDLGVRMFRALEAELGSHPCAVLVGGDVPGITPEILQESFDRLQSVDVTLGPAADGGYYLVGLRRPVPELFEDIPWSTPEVLERTLLKVRRLGLSFSLLPTLSDIDEIGDWERMKHLLD